MTDPERILRFFRELLPAAVALHADFFDRIKGTLALFVDGTGSWTVSFGDHLSHPVGEGADFDADCVAVFSTPMFAALLDGRVEGTPVVLGDTRLVEKLGQLLDVRQQGARVTNIASARERQRQRKKT